MYKSIYIGAFAMLVACGNQARDLTEIDTSTTKPTGTVDSVSASQVVLDNIAKDELFESVSVKTPRLPTGFIVEPAGFAIPSWAETGTSAPSGGTVQVPDFFVNACNGVERNMKENVTTVDLKAEGLAGTMTVSVQCNDQHYFSMSVQMAGACSKNNCFDGNGRYELKDGKLLWSLRATVKPQSGGASHDVDMGGTVKVGGSLADIRLIGFFKAAGKDGKPTGDAKPVILTWSALGVGKYSEYYVTGAGGKYRCNTPDNGKSGCCRQLGADEKPTGEQFTWGGNMCG